jgi:hypothetical protein
MRKTVQRQASSVEENSSYLLFCRFTWNELAQRDEVYVLFMRIRIHVGETLPEPIVVFKYLDYPVTNDTDNLQSRLLRHLEPGSQLRSLLRAFRMGANAYLKQAAAFVELSNPPKIEVGMRVHAPHSHVSGVVRRIGKVSGKVSIEVDGFKRKRIVSIGNVVPEES